MKFIDSKENDSKVRAVPGNNIAIKNRSYQFYGYDIRFFFFVESVLLIKHWSPISSSFFFSVERRKCRS